MLILEQHYCIMVVNYHQERNQTAARDLILNNGLKERQGHESNSFNKPICELWQTIND
jgi:hypothetical protein